jgi:small multidrug resistance pump
MAIVFEVAGTTCMKLSADFSRRLPAILMGLFYAVCFYFLTLVGGRNFIRQRSR